MTKKIFVIISISSIVFLNSCYYDKEEVLYPNNVGCEKTNPTYTNDLATIINSNCVSGCHTYGRQLPDLSTYAFVKNNINRIKSRAIDASPSIMPPSGKMSTCNTTILQNWINNGMPQ